MKCPTQQYHFQHQMLSSSPCSRNCTENFSKIGAGRYSIDAVLVEIEPSGIFVSQVVSAYQETHQKLENSGWLDEGGLVSIDSVATS